jgi:hypothetical protein
MKTIESWSNSVSVLAVDVLLDAKLIKKEDFDKAVAIVSEEISIRLIMGDYPPDNNLNNRVS